MPQAIRKKGTDILNERPPRQREAALPRAAHDCVTSKAIAPGFGKPPDAGLTAMQSSLARKRNTLNIVYKTPIQIQYS
jgi:hypothetical protein